MTRKRIKVCNDKGKKNPCPFCYNKCQTPYVVDHSMEWTQDELADGMLLSVSMHCGVSVFVTMQENNGCEFYDVKYVKSGIGGTHKYPWPVSSWFCDRDNRSLAVIGTNNLEETPYVLCKYFHTACSGHGISEYNEVCVEIDAGEKVLYAAGPKIGDRFVVCTHRYDDDTISSYLYLFETIRLSDDSEKIIRKKKIEFPEVVDSLKWSFKLNCFAIGTRIGSVHIYSSDITHMESFNGDLFGTKNINLIAWSTDNSRIAYACTESSHITIISCPSVEPALDQACSAYFHGRSSPIRLIL